ncbi:MAG: PKD domain-containing protein [Thermoplasmatales archaeon]|nr:MAG: PKD domain-containing protein [Thermoplasmatales archaeon]
MIKKIVGIVVFTLLITSVLQIVANEEEEDLYIKGKIESIVFSEPNLQEGDQYVTLNIEEATSYLINPGKPILPVYTKLFKFPFGTKIKGIECKPSQVYQKVISGIIQPSPEAVPLVNVNNAMEEKVVEDFGFMDSTVYSSMDFFPYSWYDYRIGCGLDGSRRMVFLAVHFYPVRYSPEQNMIQYVNTVDIKVEYHEPLQSVVFRDMYDMVVIAPSDFSDELQPLVDYKNDSNRPTKLVTLDDIYTGTYFPVQGRDDQEKIKYFIKSAIEGWDISYVLFAGGANYIPVRMSYVQDGSEVSFISDLYYADIYDAYGAFCSWDSNGNDIFGEYDYLGNTDDVDLHPDVHFGRLNFRDQYGIGVVVNKIITYESTGAYMDAWFSNFVVCGGDTAEDIGDVDEGEYLNQKAIDIMTGFTPEKVWASNGKLWDAENVDNAIEDGAGFLYFSGHGNPESWATHPHNDFNTWIPSHPWGYRYNRVENLNNGDMLPIVIIGGCDNCRFSGSICFGWSFLKNYHGGGIAAYGNSGLGWIWTGSYVSEGLTGGRELCMFRAYKYQNAKTTGELWSQSINNYINDFGLNDRLDYKTVEEWQPFSDPSLCIEKISDKPNKPDTPEGPASGEIGVEYNYSTSTVDPNSDLVKFCFDWDDGPVSWTDWVGSGEEASLNHIWQTPGTYEVKVKARDEYGLDSEWSNSLLVTIEAPAQPFLEIEEIKGGFGKISAVVKNIGTYEATSVDWSISLDGGLLFSNGENSGQIGSIPMGGEETVSSKFIFGFGRITVTVTALCAEEASDVQSRDGFVFLFFIKVNP